MGGFILNLPAKTEKRNFTPAFADSTLAIHSEAVDEVNEYEELA